jgi:hypothetical protein
MRLGASRLEGGRVTCDRHLADWFNVRSSSSGRSVSIHLRSQHVPHVAALRASPIGVAIGTRRGRHCLCRSAGRTRRLDRISRWRGPLREICHAPPGMGFGEGWRPKLAQSSGKQCRRQVYAAATNARNHRFLYSGIGHTVLSPPAFEQCPSSRGCAPTGPLRPSIETHMNDPAATHCAARTQETSRAPVPACSSPHHHGLTDQKEGRKAC